MRFRLCLQITGSFLGIFGWLFSEYAREIWNSLRRPKTYFDSEIRRFSAIASLSPDEGTPVPEEGPLLSKWVEGLGPWEQSVLFLHYQEGLDFGQIALRTGLHEREVVKIHTNLVRKLHALRPMEAPRPVA